MMNRLFLLTALAMSALVATDAGAQSTIASFAQSQMDATPFEYERMGLNGAPVAVTATTDITFNVIAPSFLQSPGPMTYNAQLTLNAVSNDNAQSNPIGGGFNLLSQTGFNGTFSITSGGTTLAAGSFTGGVLGQTSNDPAGAFFSVGQADLTSDIFQPLFNESFVLSLGQTPGFSISGTAFQDFEASVSGLIQASVIPEPATLAMAGLGVFVLPIALRTARRRRRSGSAS